MKSLSALARDLGVSVTVVSHVYNGKWKEKRVSEELALKIQEAIRREGCRPSGVGVQLKTGRSMTVSVILPDLCNTFGFDIIRGAEGVMTPSGFMMLLANSKFGATEAETISAAVSKGVDGIIVNPYSPLKDFKDSIASLGRKAPVVLVDNCFPGSGLDFVSTDNRKGAVDLVKRLFANGRRRIAYLGSAKSLFAAQERYKGFQSGLGICGLKEDPRLVRRTLLGEDGLPESLNSLLEAKPDALLVESLQYFKTGVEMLDFRKIRTPEDISLAGFDSLPQQRNSGVVRCLQDGETIGRLAASRLKEILLSNANSSGRPLELYIEPKIDASIQ